MLKNVAKAVQNIKNPALANVLPPKPSKIDELTVLRSIHKTFTPKDTHYYPYYLEDAILSEFRYETPFALYCKACGRNAARIAVNKYLPNDIALLSSEYPKIDAFASIQIPESVLEDLENGVIELDEAMEKLINVLAPKECISLYESNKDHKWKPEMLHDLLDLTSRAYNTNNNPDYFFGSNVNHYGEIPFPEEVFVKKSILKAEKKRGIVDAERPKNRPWEQDSFPEKLFEENIESFDHIPSAYSSLIIGASRNSNVKRALELAKAGDFKISKEAFISLLYNMDQLRYENLDGPSIWLKISEVTNKIPLSFRTDEEFLGKIYASVMKSIASVSKSDNSVNPVLAKLLLEVQNKSVKVPFGFYYHYFSSYLRDENLTTNEIQFVFRFLDSLKKDIEHLGAKENLFSQDDLSLFPCLMDIAVMLRNPRLAHEIDQLIRGKEDRRHLLCDYDSMRKYYFGYLITCFNSSQIHTVCKQMEFELRKKFLTIKVNEEVDGFARIWSLYQANNIEITMNFILATHLFKRIICEIVSTPAEAITSLMRSSQNFASLILDNINSYKSTKIKLQTAVFIMARVKKDVFCGEYLTNSLSALDSYFNHFPLICQIIERSTNKGIYEMDKQSFFDMIYEMNFIIADGVKTLDNLLFFKEEKIKPDNVYANISTSLMLIQQITENIKCRDEEIFEEVSQNLDSLMSSLVERKQLSPIISLQLLQVSLAVGSDKNTWKLVEYLSTQSKLSRKNSALMSFKSQDVVNQLNHLIQQNLSNSTNVAQDRERQVEHVRSLLMTKEKPSAANLK